jgi:hypothetical protein
VIPNSLLLLLVERGKVTVRQRIHWKRREVSAKGDCFFWMEGLARDWMLRFSMGTTRLATCTALLECLRVDCSGPGTNRRSKRHPQAPGACYRSSPIQHLSVRSSAARPAKWNVITLLIEASRKLGLLRTRLPRGINAPHRQATGARIVGRPS